MPASILRETPSSAFTPLGQHLVSFSIASWICIGIVTRRCPGSRCQGIGPAATARQAAAWQLWGVTVRRAVARLSGPARVAGPKCPRYWISSKTDGCLRPIGSYRDAREADCERPRRSSSRARSVRRPRGGTPPPIETRRRSLHGGSTVRRGIVSRGLVPTTRPECSTPSPRVGVRTTRCASRGSSSPSEPSWLPSFGARFFAAFVTKADLISKYGYVSGVCRGGRCVVGNVGGREGDELGEPAPPTASHASVRRRGGSRRAAACRARSVLVSAAAVWLKLGRSRHDLALPAGWTPGPSLPCLRNQPGKRGRRKTIDTTKTLNAAR